ncbi:serine hydrolase [Brevibacillus choshinensis]|uniref:serine hydrolase n=1 Tax=Brevibacillus choshinensis TaxID=54911 RepID=UPI002E1B6FD2|nr:class A beta-lactamase-related serine hydrolase [Brevibacillus choshinensis]MED4784448.1 class A beta-lactamase-related serine hydrolase [Brevibacillus choshinensis]
MEQLRQTLSDLLVKAQGSWGVVVEDLDHGTRFEHRAEESFIAESVIKVPIMAAVYAAADQGQFTMDDRLSLRKEDLVKGSGLLYTLSPGLKLTIRELVTLMIIQSDNTATNVLIDLVGKEQIDQTMYELGMQQSKYSRKLMIYPVDISENNTITACDVSRMLGGLATSKFLSHRSCEEMIGIMKKQQVRNGLPSLLPSPEDETDWEIACKSGWDTGRQHDVGVLYVGDRRFSIVALSQDVQAEAALDVLGQLGKEVYEYAKGSPRS